MAFPSQPTIDSCVRMNENPISLGGLWTGTGIQIVSNQMAEVAASADIIGWVNIATSADVEFYITMPVLPTGSELIRLIFRSSTVATQGPNGYVLEYNGGNQLTLARLDGGAWTTLDHGDAGGIGNGSSFGIAATGSTLQAYVNAGGGWIPHVSAVDATYGSAGYFNILLAFGTGARYTTIAAGPVSSVPPGGGSGVFSGAAVPSGHSIDRGMYKAMARGIAR